MLLQYIPYIYHEIKVYCLLLAVITTLSAQYQYYSDYQYFTDQEVPGGGPYIDGNINFGANDLFEGPVRTNGTITFSNYGCPTFGSPVYAANGINYNGICDEGLFYEHGWTDSAAIFPYPTLSSVQNIIESADFSFTANNLTGRLGIKDTLIMTHVEFIAGGFQISQWPYKIPPVTTQETESIRYHWDSNPSLFEINSGGIGFNSSYQGEDGYLNADTLFLSNVDQDGNDVTSSLDYYSIGDTLFINSMDYFSIKRWSGVITNISLYSENYVFEITSWLQHFPSNIGFFNDEQVQLILKEPLDTSIPFNNFINYHNHPDSIGYQCTESSFHHFDFLEPDSLPNYYLPPTQYLTNEEAIIYIEDGQVLVDGIVDGQYTLITNEYTEYFRDDNPWIPDRVYNNIWIINDLIYEDSYPPTGEIISGSPNRLGLISGANVIIANTLENGGMNSTYASDVVVNASIIALNESFVTHYWQNTAENCYNPNPYDPYLSLADGRGPYRFTDAFQTTGDSDFRGFIRFWGSISQKKRGYIKRNYPGPYLTTDLGYDKDYHYDFNLWYYPPPGFELLRDSLLVEESLLFFPIHQGDRWQYEVSVFPGDSTFIQTIEISDPITMPNGKEYIDMDIFGFLRVDTISLKVYRYNPTSDCINNDEDLFNLIYPEVTSDEYEEINCDNNLFNVWIGQKHVGSLLDSASYIDYYYYDTMTNFIISQGFGISHYSVSSSAETTNWSLVAAEINGELYGDFVSINESELVTNQYILHNNYPNPANPITVIKYELPTDSDVRIEIFDLKGRNISTLVNKAVAAGIQSVIWNGTDTYGKPVASGMYIYQIQTGSFIQSKKMVLLK